MASEKHPLFRCTATGDAMITRRLPVNGSYDGFEEVRDFIRQGEFCFGNLETTVHNFESYAAARSGGSWLCAPPGVLDDMRAFGINIISTANNHALDYSHKGLVRTLEYLEASKIPFTGTGRNLADASRPVYLDTVSGRYALIACSMTFNPEDSAGNQTGSLPGRPGLNTIRVDTTYQLPDEELAHIKRIADKLELNLHKEIIRKEGYLPQLKPGQQPFGELMFEAGENAQVINTINPVDMKRILDAIAEARFMADYVVIAMHNHKLKGGKKENVDDISKEFSHRCLDAGADAIIGTGPHLLRPMEIYNGKPIFYCLGDFINQLETILRAPDGMFAKEKLDINSRLDELFNTRSNFGQRGLSYDPVMFESVIPYWEARGGQLTKLTLMPIEEHVNLPRSRHGWPQKNTACNIMERFSEMCKPYGVDIKIDADGMGTVDL